MTNQAETPRGRRVPLVVAAVVAAQLILAVAFNLSDGPVGWLETEGRPFNQVIPGYTLALWGPDLGDFDSTDWLGAIALFAALPVGLWAYWQLGRGPRRTWWIWTIFALSVLMTLAFQTHGTLDAYRLFG